MNNKKCPICSKGNLVRETRKETYSFKGFSKLIDQPGLWCGSCGEGILDGDDLMYNYKELDNFHEEVKMEIAKNLKEIRLKLKFPQKEAAEICGGGVNAFYKYEKGEIEPPQATVKLLTILSNHPDLIDEVRYSNIHVFKNNRPDEVVTN